MSGQSIADMWGYFPFGNVGFKDIDLFLLGRYLGVLSGKTISN